MFHMSILRLWPIRLVCRCILKTDACWLFHIRSSCDFIQIKPIKWSSKRYLESQFLSNMLCQYKRMFEFLHTKNISCNCIGLKILDLECERHIYNYRLRCNISYILHDPYLKQQLLFWTFYRTLSLRIHNKSCISDLFFNVVYHIMHHPCSSISNWEERIW